MSPSSYRRLYRRGIRSLLPLAAAGALACGGDPASPSDDCARATPQSFQVPVSTVTNSGLTVALFTFAQHFEAARPGCPQGQHDVSLVVTSTATVPVTFAFEVTGFNQAGARVWTNQGRVSRLAPGETLRLGVAASTTSRLDQTDIRVQLTGIQQVP